MYHCLEVTKKLFVGKTLKEITRISDDTVCIEFGDGVKVNLSIIGGCCSNSIIYAIEMPKNLVGATLLDIIENGWEKDSEAYSTADDEVTALEKVKLSNIEFSPGENKVWNVVLKTNHGNALIRHINASNGYYDGETSYTIVNPWTSPT